MKMKNIKTKSVGLFPLSLVILPNESIRLHIYQSHIKALVNDCFASGKDFVVPFVYNGQPTNYGTCVKLVDVERFYPDGKMDIKVEGAYIVKISNISKQKNVAYKVGEAELVESSLPQIHAEELEQLFEKYLKFSSIKNIEVKGISLYEMARNIKLDKETKIKLLKNASNSVVQSKIILNELRLLVLTNELQDAAGFRYYMN
jgi:Lon protease-like protein